MKIYTQQPEHTSRVGPESREAGRQGGREAGRQGGRERRLAKRMHNTSIRTA